MTLEMIGAAVAKAGATYLAGRFKTSVIERWNRTRAEAFFDSFVSEFVYLGNAATDWDKVHAMLDEIMADEGKSELLMEAYRSVCLSVSNTVGPKVIAVLTARLIADRRIATPEEERLFLAAENLNDRDFKEMVSFFGDHSDPSSDSRADAEMKIEVCDEQEDSNWQGGSINVGSIGLGDAVGNWALKLHNAGLLNEEVVKESRPYQADSEMHVEEDGVLTIWKWYVVAPPQVRTFVDTVKRITEERLPSGE